MKQGKLKCERKMEAIDEKTGEEMKKVERKRRRGKKTKAEDKR